jgi:hypothetical protein
VLFRLAVDTGQAANRNVKADFLLNFANDGVPRSLVNINATAWEIPQIVVSTMAKQDPPLIVKDNCEGADIETGHRDSLCG